MNKAGVREYILGLRADLEENNKKLWDEKIFSLLVEAPSVKKAKNVFIYVSFQKEVDTHSLINYFLAQGKTVAVPLVISKEKGMIAIIIDGISQLTPNKMGILEPVYDENRILQPKDIDLLIVPGLAFDKNGGRIGYGGGFYDRYMAKVKENVPRIAVAYDFQILDFIPMEKHDMKVDYVITN